MRKILGLAVLVCAVPAGATFEDSGFGPRDIAMGGAFTAVTEDPGVLAYNPAALGHVSGVEVTSSYLRQYRIPSGETDRDSTRGAGVVPIRQDILDGAFGFGLRYDRRFHQGGDREVNFAYGTRGFRETERGSVDIGGAFKLLSSSFDVGGKGGTRATLDLGTLWRVTRKFSLGASLLNFGKPKFSAGPNSDRAPLILKIGAAEQVRNFIIAADFTKREPSAGFRSRYTGALGFERWWATARAGQYAFRSGFSHSDFTRTWNWGVGWRSQGARLDYVMMVPLTGKRRLGHGLGLTVRFGSTDPEAEYEKLLAEELQYRKRLGAALEAGSTKQGKLSQELAQMRTEIANLKDQLARKQASEGQARKQVRELETRQQKAAEHFEKLRREREEAAKKTVESLYQEDWRAYQKAKLEGAPNAVLLERVNRILREHKDAGVDLSEAGDELRRLQLAQ